MLAGSCKVWGESGGGAKRRHLKWRTVYYHLGYECCLFLVILCSRKEKVIFTLIQLLPPNLTS
jgi:hypothetical protein